MRRDLLKIREAVNRLQLDLADKVVLTEAATGPYRVTPAMAALAGAEVIAFTRDTPYGTISEVRDQTNHLLHELGIDISRVTITGELSPEMIGRADIITNAGHLRPLDKAKLQHLKNNAVVSVMYEAWELREADIDIPFCREKNIRVGATNERHSGVDVFNYLGDMAVKQIFDAGLCPYNNRFTLICNNDFGPYIAKTLSKLCRNLGVCDLEKNRSGYDKLKIDWIGNFPDLSAVGEYAESDAVIFTANPFEKTWIGDPQTELPVAKLKAAFRDPYILRFAGHIDETFCKGQLKYFPEKVKPGHMGVLPSAVGDDPIFRLQAGGLKVGELLTKNLTEFNNEQLVTRII